MTNRTGTGRPAEPQAGRRNLIPWDKLQSFLGTHLPRGAAASSRLR